VDSLKRQTAIGTHCTQERHGSTGDSDPGNLQDSSANARPGVQKPVRLLLVDSMPVVLRGLASAAQDTIGIELVGSTGDAERVLPLLKQTRPDVLLLDVLARRPGSRSMRVQTDVVRKIHRLRPETRVIVFTHFHPRHMVDSLLEQGARGVWSKFDDITGLVAALRQPPGHSSRILSPTVQQVLQSGEDEQHEADLLAVLTRREREVLKLVLNGEDSYQIGERLGISPRTVSTHRSRILQKTKARSFFELIGCLQQLEELGH
jgi:DNA-binding NarL/FixJ family response regulator